MRTGVCRGEGARKHSLRAPSPSCPMALAPPCTPRELGGGALFPPLSAWGGGGRGTPPLHLCAQTGNAGRRTKGTPPPSFGPYPRSLEQDGERGTPAAPPLTAPPSKRERGPLLRPNRAPERGTTRHNPRPLVARSRTRANGRGCVPLPYTRLLRGRRGGLPRGRQRRPPFCPFPAAIHARTGRG
jgi:hypothetical protein